MGKWGWPSRVQADWGGENIVMKAMMEEVRGGGRGSYLAGPSIHNQWIERESHLAPNSRHEMMNSYCRILRLWRDLFIGTINPFYSLFLVMEHDGILDMSSEIHLWALYLVFLPRINRALDIFTQTWNNHKLSSQCSKSPYQLYIRGEQFIVIPISSCSP